MVNRPLKQPLVIFITLIVIIGLAYFFTPVKSLFTSFRAITLDTPTTQVIKGQFKGRRGQFVLVTESTPLYRSATASAPLRHALNHSQRVRVVHRHQHWAFVTSENGETALGWVNNDFLAYPSQFQISRWEYGQFHYTKSMFHGRVYPKPNGRFLVSWTAEGNGLHLNGRYHGSVMEYSHLIWLKKDAPDHYFDFFFINISDHILSELRYQSSTR
jgi:hypothetical protein